MRKREEEGDGDLVLCLFINLEKEREFMGTSYKLKLSYGGWKVEMARSKEQKLKTERENQIFEFDISVCQFSNE